jgi:hypothetical protein
MVVVPDRRLVKCLYPGLQAKLGNRSDETIKR